MDSISLASLEYEKYLFGRVVITSTSQPFSINLSTKAEALKEPAERSGVKK